MKSHITYVSICGNRQKSPSCFIVKYMIQKQIIHQWGGANVANASAFRAGQVENWPGWVKFCIQHIKDICFQVSSYTVNIFHKNMLIISIRVFYCWDQMATKSSDQHIEMVQVVDYCQTSSINRTKSKNLNVSRLILQRLHKKPEQQHGPGYPGIVQFQHQRN